MPESSPSLPDVVHLGRHVERVTRKTGECRAGCTVVGLARGHCRLAPGDEGEFASGAKNRVHWFGVDTPLGNEDVREMMEAVREQGATGAFIWVSPAGCAGGGEEELTRVGATRVPWVKYVALAREPEAMVPARETKLTVRMLEVEEVEEVMRSVIAGATPEGVASARTLVEREEAEIYAAFDGDTPVASGALIMDGGVFGWAYMGWAGTSEAHRGKGAQSALIAARVSRAVELGASWCVSETNTAVQGSLRNLVRSGFAPAVEWGVFRVRVA